MKWRPIALLIIAIILAVVTIPAIGFIESTFFPTDGDNDFVVASLLTQTPTLAPTPTIAPQTYTVQAGDSLFEIARLHGVSMENMAQVNQIEDVELIYEGQVLLLPDSAATLIPSETPLPITLTLTPNPSIETNSETATPTVTLSLTPSIDDFGIITPTPFPTQPIPQSINNIALGSFIILPPATVANVHDIFAVGQSMGRNPRAFSKLGDSTIENPHFLARYDGREYNLGEWGYLQTVIDAYQGSYSRQGVAVQRGLHTWSVLDPLWAPYGTCFPNETMVACEIRLHNPSLMIVRLGSNDRGVPEATERNLRAIVESIIAEGVIPVLGTKPDRQEGSNINNDIIRRVAHDYNIPLFDFDIVAETLPAHGLTSDGVHMSFYFAHDYSVPLAFQRGHAVHNLVTLIMLDRLWQIVNEDD